MSRPNLPRKFGLGHATREIVSHGTEMTTRLSGLLLLVAASCARAQGIFELTSSNFNVAAQQPITWLIHIELPSNPTSCEVISCWLLLFSKPSEASAWAACSCARALPLASS